MSERMLADSARYPPKMIPGCHIIIHTSARDDQDARMLLGAVGFPFYGKFIN
jgi:large subunit ribosomal protein L5